ncbi:helix-turn-helix transcriptional regulator [Nocardioides sp. NPDC051685]|uniref:helix-turn-helix transcriptional regulator n=1 Tax=Nocardioides sp. NPDC051685 TaxID=3364334 RepID=UPI0037BD93EB
MEVVTTVDLRRELGDFLRSRRERRRPEDVGLRVSGRRRTPGLRREEVATLSAVSVTWYTWLEQGRPDVRASRQVLSSLAEVLGLDDLETQHLFRLSGELPPRRAERSERSEAGRYQRLLDHLDPNPAFVVDRHFFIVAWNRGAELLFPGLGQLADAERNVIWLTFTSPQVRAMSESWEAEAAEAVAFFRSQTAVDMADPEVAKLVADLESVSEEFRTLWGRRDLAAIGSHTRVVRHPKVGRVELELTKMRTVDDELTMVAYLAPPGSDVLRALADAVRHPS